MGTKGDLVFGRVVDIPKPFRFDAKNILHAGYVRPDSDSSNESSVLHFAQTMHEPSMHSS